MKAFFAASVIALATVFSPAMSHAAVIDLTINPTSDGSLGICSFCAKILPDPVVVASFGFQGAIKFSSAGVAAPVEQALLSLNAFNSTMWGMGVDIYGYGTANGQLVESDLNAGAFLGRLPMPFTVTPGQEFFFDVTSFVKETHAPFLAFNLRNTSMVGADLFRSVRGPEGRGAQLLVTYGALPAVDVPEPAQAALVLAALMALGASRRRAHSVR